MKVLGSKLIYLYDFKLFSSDEWNDVEENMKEKLGLNKENDGEFW